MLKAARDFGIETADDSLDATTIIGEDLSNSAGEENADADDSLTNPHIGLGSSFDSIADFQDNRTDMPVRKSCPHRKKGQQPDSLRHPGNIQNKKAEHDLWLATARVNDGTIMRNPAPRMPKRGSITISLNEFADPNKDGGLTSNKRLRREKPLVTIVGPSRDFFLFIQDTLRAALSRGAESRFEDYEVQFLFGDSGDGLGSSHSPHQDVVKAAIDEFQQNRENPKRSRRSVEEINMETQENRNDNSILSN